MIKVYGKCPKCSIIKDKLKERGIGFEVEEDMDKIIDMGKANGISSMPIVVWEGMVLDFGKCIKKLQEI